VTLADSNDERAARKLLRQLPADPDKAIPMLVQLLSHDSDSVTKHVEALLIRFGEEARANLEEAVSNLPENSVARAKATRVLKAIEEGSHR
jgi:hypothetical protein